MTADARSLTFPLAAPQATRERRWIESPLFDAGFFLLSPVVVLPLVFLTLLVSPRFALLFFFLAFPHYVSTFAFYFWDENRPRHRARWIAFFAGPVIIATAYWALFYFQVPRVMQMFLFLWNIFHVSRQSSGILSIYRHRAGVFDSLQRNATNYAILSSTLFLAFWNVQTHPQFGPFLAEISPSLTLVVKTTLGIVALTCLIWLALALQKRLRDGQVIGAAEVAFLLISVAIFHPYLWMQDSASATAVMLLPHYLQYLGIVWLLHRRRFRTSEGSGTQRVLQKLSSHTPLLLLTLVGIGFSFATASIVLRHSGNQSLFETIYLLLAFEHFYLDGLFWAFKDPSVRKSFSPYLTTYTPPQPAAAA